MRRKILQLSQPADFNFRRTVLSHGWYSLPPFALDKEKWILSRVFELDNKPPVWAQILENKDKIEVHVAAETDESDAAKIIKDARHILRLDDNFAEFYALVADQPELNWIKQRGAGRLLRSPTVWEDLVKTICTTNCSWALTQKMAERLVDKLGDDAGNDQKTFPTAAKMAQQNAEFYQNEIRAGYRSDYFAELAQQAANQQIDVESWATTELTTPELKKQMKQIKGVGDYAAENLLKLLGRYDGFALDSWLRMKFANKHNGGETCEDSRIKAHYERYGAWRGLALWCDMTREWIDD